MFKSLLKLFGRSGQSKKKGGLSKEVQDQITNSIEAFKNRTIHKTLTAQIIDSTPDENLLQVVFDNLCEKLPSDYEKEYQTVMTWNKSRLAIYVIWLLEAEVNNGGFNQFYCNSSGQFYELLPDALRLIGANKFAELTASANDIYEKEYKKITEHQDGSLEGFSKSYEDNPLNDCDDKFFELYNDENLLQLQLDYIRKYKIEFEDQ